MIHQLKEGTGETTIIVEPPSLGIYGEVIPEEHGRNL
jgi:hypothetical protein